MAVYLLVPMAFSLLISLIFAILPLIRVAIVQTILSGYFVLDEVPRISKERKEKDQNNSIVPVVDPDPADMLKKKQ